MILTSGLMVTSIGCYRRRHSFCHPCHVEWIRRLLGPLAPRPAVIRSCPVLQRWVFCSSARRAYHWAALQSTKYYRSICTWEYDRWPWSRLATVRHSLRPATVLGDCRWWCHSRSIQSNGDRWPWPGLPHVTSALLARWCCRKDDRWRLCRVCLRERGANFERSICHRAGCCIRPGDKNRNEWWKTLSNAAKKKWNFQFLKTFSVNQ